MIELLGALNDQNIISLIKNNHILNAKIENVQPASLDLTLSDEVWRMKGTFLPRPNESIETIIKEGSLFKIDLNTTPLEVGGIYIIKLNESLNLPEEIFGISNNKSSTGRVNLQTRLLLDGVTHFGKIPKGYKGSLYLEVIPKSFLIKLTPGQSLNQIRLFNGQARLNESELKYIYQKFQLLYDKNKQTIPFDESLFDEGGLTMTIDLDFNPVGWRAINSNNKVLDFAARNLNPHDFFEPIPKPSSKELVLKAGEFYILVTKERVRVPPDFAMEVVPYDPSKGEFRTHFAGFFDPGWGYGEKGEFEGWPAVLEVFSYDNDFVLRDGQPICKMVYEKMIERPKIVYGSSTLSSHYVNQQGPTLSKHFKQ